MRSSGVFFRDFPATRVVLPAFHAVTTEQVVSNVAIARDAGADGAFLVHSGRSADAFLSLYAAVQRQVSRFWLGINCLDLSPEEVFEAIGAHGARVDGVWVDEAGIVGADASQPAAEEIVTARFRSRFRGLYFGGVAYRGPVADPAAVVRRAAYYLDAVATRGPSATDADAIARAVARVVTMRTALSSTALVVASGITPDNVGHFLPHANAFIAGRGVRWNASTLDPPRVRALVDAARAYAPPRPTVDIALDYGEAHEYGYRHGRQVMRPMIDTLASGRDALGHALAIVLRDEEVGHYLVDPGHGLVLFSAHRYHRKPETIALPRPLLATETVEFVWDWLQRMPALDDEHDGAALPGFRVYNHQFGIVGDWWDAVVAIKPMYVYVPK